MAMNGSRARLAVGTMAAVVAFAANLGIAAAQAAVTQADIERLQNSVTAAGRDIASMAGQHPSLAATLRDELDQASDEVIYLKVKLRKQETVTRQDYSTLRDRLDDIRTRALAPDTAVKPAPDPRATVSASQEPQGVRSGARRPRTVPVGTELDVRLQRSLSSETAVVNDKVDATTLADLRNDAGIIIPAGSVVHGVVASVHPATRTERTGRLTLEFHELTVDGRDYPIRSTVTQALESEGLKAEAPKIATGAGVGAIIGGILGGVKGAIAGILIGGGGTIAATEGEDVQLPAGTVLRIRFDSPLDLVP
jgi:hypothetical protein